MRMLDGCCVSSALRTEFHGLCQCQTCEVQFFSWDVSVIVDSRDTGERAAPRLAGELGRPEAEGRGKWGSGEKHSVHCERTVLSRAPGSRTHALGRPFLPLLLFQLVYIY